MRSLPSLNALRVFEVAAKQLSFTLAAKQLSVTQGSISKRIKQLEDYLEIDKTLFRPTEVEVLIGDPSKAIKKLDWNPRKTSFDELINMMVKSDGKLISNLNSDSLNTDKIKEIPHFKE